MSHGYVVCKKVGSRTFFYDVGAKSFVKQFANATKYFDPFSAAKDISSSSKMDRCSIVYYEGTKLDFQ